MVKVPPVPSSLADTFLVSGGAAIAFLHLPVEKDVRETDPRTPMGQGPFRSGRERRAHEEQIEAKHARDFTQLRSSPER